jgi:hypothetical protein
MHYIMTLRGVTVDKFGERKESGASAENRIPYPDTGIHFAIPEFTMAMCVTIVAESQ